MNTGGEHNTDCTVLCAGTLSKADFTTRVSAAADAGFGAITLFPEQYLAARNNERLSLADMQSIMAEHGIVMDTIDPLLDWFGAEASSSELLMYEMAEAFSAPSINAAPAFAPDMEQQQLVDTLGRLCERAAKRGLSVDLEFLPWTIIPNLKTAIAVLEELPVGNAGLTLDCLHFYRSGGTVDALKSITPEQASLITNIQLCDVAEHPGPMTFSEKMIASRELLITARNSIRVMGLKPLLSIAGKAKETRSDAKSLMREASNSRLLPGQGDVPIREMIQVLHGLGVKPTLGIEVFSQRLNKLPADAVARESMQAYLELGSC